MKVNFSSCVFRTTACFDRTNRARPDTFTAQGLLRLSGGSRYWKTCIAMDALARSLASLIHPCPVLLLLHDSLLEIPKNSGCKLKKSALVTAMRFSFNRRFQAFRFPFSYSAAPPADLIYFASLSLSLLCCLCYFFT